MIGQVDPAAARAIAAAYADTPSRRHPRAAAAYAQLEVTTVAAECDRHDPLMGNDLGRSYDRFRGVHDVLRHARLRVGFDRDGEFTAWRSQDRFHSPLARWALATELHGRHSVLWTTGDLAEPKVVLLAPRLLRRSVTAALRPAPHRTAPGRGSS